MKRFLTGVRAPIYQNDGTTGATAATRWVGATASGAPVSGTFAVGDFVIAQNGHVWICTGAGTPGTWVDASSGSGTPATTVTSETTYGIASAVGTSTNYARQDHTHGSPATPVTSIGVGARTGAVTLTAADIGAGTFPGANSYSGLQTFNAGITLPSGQALLTGTRSVVTGTRATTTNASDTVDLGTFSTTGGALELRIHAHLAAPAAGTTASVTKVYEIAAGALMGTASTWYLCLPADASANAAATNDFALEVQRTAAGTFQFRFRQKSIGIAGQITFTAETLGDVAVTFTPSTAVTAAPAAVSTVHPSNAFVAAAGNVGIGTDSPAHLLEVNGQINGVGVLDNGTQVYSPQNTNLTSSAPPAITNAGAAGSATTYARSDHTHLGYSSTNANLAVSGPPAITIASTVGTATDYARSDHSHSGVTSVSAGTGISVNTSIGTVTVTNTGIVTVSGLSGPSPETGRGIQQVWDQLTTAGTTTTSNTTEQAIFAGVGSFTFVSGRRYILYLYHHGHCGTASTSGSLLFQVKLGSGTGGAAIGLFYLSPATTGQQSISAAWEMACTADIAAQTTSLSLTVTAQGTANAWAPAGASGNIGERTKIWLVDIGV